MTTTPVELSVELVTAALHAEGDAAHAEFIRYVAKRMREEGAPGFHLAAVLASFAAAAIGEWADDIGSTPDELMRSIALDVRDETENPPEK